VTAGHGRADWMPRGDIMADEQDRTMQIVTNLDRAGIEKKLAQARQLAEAFNLSDVKQLLTDVNGKSPAELQDIIERSVSGLIGKDEYGRLQDILELVELNLKNIS
jgi:hypothetical protein